MIKIYIYKKKNSSLTCSLNLLVAPDCGVVDPLLESSLEVRDAFRTTPEPHLFAQIVTTFSADSTLAAGDADLEGYSIANLEAIDLRTNANHDTRGFVAKRQGRAGAEVAIGKLFVVAHIRAADASRFDLDLKLAYRRFLDTSFFLKLHISTDPWSAGDGSSVPVLRLWDHAIPRRKWSTPLRGCWWVSTAPEGRPRMEPFL
jgi:hypothetical protein